MSFVLTLKNLVVFYHKFSYWSHIGVVPASRVAMDTSSLLIAFGPPLTFKAPAPKLIISDEFKMWIKSTGNKTFYLSLIYNESYK